jgi:signal transduction histidine kinase
MRETPVSQNIRVLLLEDSDDDSMLLARALTKGGFDAHIHRVVSRQEAISALDGSEWDIILADCYLPGYSARELLDYIREHAVEIPCIVVSAKIGEENAAALMRLGAADFVTKSNLQRLAPAVRRELQDARLRREHRRTKHKLKRTQNVVRQHQSREHELRLLNQVISGVAHEVRNPLNAITALLEAFFLETEDQESLQDYRIHISQQVDRLSKLMDDLLNLGKPIDASEFEQFHIQELSTKTIALWRDGKRAKRYEVRLENHAQRDMVCGNPTHLQNALINLLDNAANHCTDETPIILRLSNEADQIVIQVIDRGSGIDAEHLEHVVEPFFTTRRAGTGLGLGIVRNTVEAHNGTISIRNNEPPPGVTAEIRLPAVGSLK